MPVEILTASQRTEWERFPEEIDDASLTAFFSFADDELAQIAAHRDTHGRFAIAVVVGALRWLGFVPTALEELPEPAAALIASQLDIALSSIAPARLNAERDARAEHISQAVAISAFGPCRDSHLDALRAWLADRALGHDGPLALLRSAVDRLRRERLVRPGLTVLERLVAAARSDGEQEIHRRVAPLLTPGLQDGLDELLVVGAGATAAPVKRLGQETRSVGRIGESIEKLELLRSLRAEDWDLGMIPANRRRMLAQYVRHATSQAIGRRDPVFRHPAMLAFCAEAAARVTDEIVDLFDDGIGIQHAKARRALVKLKLDIADSANASVVLLGELLEILLDPGIPDPKVRQAVWQRATPEQLQLALDLAAEIKRPLEDNHVEQLGERYNAARQFAPRLLATLRLRANPDGEALLAAVDVLRELNRRGARKVPNDAPVGFVPRSWRPYVHPPEGGIDRHHWELCLLSELRGALRAGEIWVQGSRRYTDPERFLIPRTDWPATRPGVLHDLELPPSAEDRLGQLLERTARHRDVLNHDLQADEADVTIGEQGNLSVKRLRAEPREPNVDELAELGLDDATIDDNGYVTATLPAAGGGDPATVIGLVAHVDTSPDAPGAGVAPIVHRAYDGGTITLPRRGTTLDPATEPHLASRTGHDIVTGSGDTLLGADDKAGVAEIMTAVAHLQANPGLPRRTIRVCFTPDEEIGEGATLFDVSAFGARCAYTLDGSSLGEVQDETFSALEATLTVTGVDVHPGFATGILVNAARVAARIVAALPQDSLTPETTSGREGFIHVFEISGDAAVARVRAILRDFDDEVLAGHAELLRSTAQAIVDDTAGASLQVEIVEQYPNMRAHLEPFPEVVERAIAAVRAEGLEPLREPIRGGTDGSRFSAMGLPTPNIFTGGHAYHSVREWASLQDMAAAAAVIVRLAGEWAAD